MALWLDLLLGTLVLVGVLFGLVRFALRRYGNRNRAG
jgi:hypothetical protein